ncbi:MAG: hypothetical protein EXR72_12340 [Myxococcales bacterium]|nr:hypothetical protein [Myxococcales bacterium]
MDRAIGGRSHGLGLDTPGCARYESRTIVGGDGHVAIGEPHMTFVEAAIAILKREGKPLHFKTLTEIALKENLLTVVGRTPEVTMQQRLSDALRKDPTGPLTREKPGIFGLHSYAPAEKVPSAVQVPTLAKAAEKGSEGAPAAVTPSARSEAADPAAAEDHKRRRRRGGRGRRRRGEGVEGTGTAAAASDDGSDSDGQDGAEEKRETGAPEPAAESPQQPQQAIVPSPPFVPAATAKSPGPGPERRSFAEAAALVAAARAVPTSPEARGQDASPAPVRLEGPVSPSLINNPQQAAVPGGDAPGAAVAVDLSGSEAIDEELSEQLDAHRGPMIAPAFGTEELVRGEDHRPVFEGGGRHRRGERHRGRERGAKPHEPRRAAPAAEGHPAPSARPQPAPPAASAPHAPAVAARPPAPMSVPVASSSSGTPLDAVVEVLRGGDGRPQHVKQIVDLALKRKLMRGEPADLWRLVRVAVLAEMRQREGSGQRARVKPTGGSNYQLGDRKLESELFQYERDLADRATRLSEATRVALHRRIARLSPQAFEVLGRLLLERIGVQNVDVVKRGEGRLYLGGERAIGAQRIKVLIAVRPGEGELKSASVSELRAGIARGFDEGLLLAAGRAGAEATTELAAGAGSGGAVELYDGDGLATLCLRHGVGVIKRAVEVDALDVELFAELTEA